MKTDITHAQEKVLRYLTGEDVDPVDLENAYDLLKSVNPGSLGELRDAVGITPVIPADCLLCRSNLAELCSLAPQERSAEMPELVNHIRACDDCRARFRMTRELWQDLTSTATSAVRELSSSIQIVVEKGWQWLRLDPDTEVVFGTLAAARGVAMGGTGEGTVRQEWRVEDDESGYSFLFTAFVSPGSGGVALQCEVVNEKGASVLPEEVHVDVRNRESDSRLVAGGLDDFVEDPLELPAGQWTFLFACETDIERREWKINLSIGEEGDVVSGT